MVGGPPARPRRRLARLDLGAALLDAVPEARDGVADLLRHPARALDQLAGHGTRGVGGGVRLLTRPRRRLLEVGRGGVERAARLRGVLASPALGGELLVVTGEPV